MAGAYGPLGSQSAAAAALSFPWWRDLREPPLQGPSPSEQRRKASPMKSGLLEELWGPRKLTLRFPLFIQRPVPASAHTPPASRSAVMKHTTMNGPCSRAGMGPHPRFLANWSCSFRQLTCRATPTEVSSSVKLGSRQTPPRGTGRGHAGVKEETGNGFPGDLL